MVRILNSTQLKALDGHTIASEPISSINLMERASRAFVAWFVEKFNALNKIGVVCGTGNNGGDGLAVARMLREWDYPVTVWIVRGGVPQSQDFSTNLQRLVESKLAPQDLQKDADSSVFAGCDVIIDALFGYGLSRPLDGIYADVVRSINTTEAIRVAIDMPSGLMADAPSSGEVVQAHYTVSFHLPKLAFFFPDCYRFTGEWTIVDIGLSKSFIRQEQSNYFYINRKSVGRLLKKRKRFDHKGTFGHALLVSGSYGKIGAAVLSARALLRSGAGLLSIHAPACGYTVLQTAVPEAMVVTDPNEKHFSEAPALEQFTTVGIGPGLGTHNETLVALRHVLEKFERPVVLDADALNILAANRELFHIVPQGSILTPHPREFERLVGKWQNDFDRLDKQRSLAGSLKCVIVLKGAYTSIATPDGKVFFNSTGNPGLATGGTGDVLTGILTGLIAQGYRSEEAAILGVYLHGTAADLAVSETGEESMIASDLIGFLPAAFRHIRR
jgi:ADP-dependent NAD(P)H-hydrate dehydratase / NAD(P)H-hydrate epimerase